MSRSLTLTGNERKIRERLQQMVTLENDVKVLLAVKQDRHEQLTRRYERLERRTDRITNPTTARSRSLLEEFDRLSEQHTRSEAELDVWENEVLEPLTQLLEVLDTLVA